MNKFIVKFVEKKKYNPITRDITLTTSGGHFDAVSLIHNSFGSDKRITIISVEDLTTGVVHDFTKKDSDTSNSTKTTLNDSATQIKLNETANIISE